MVYLSFFLSFRSLADKDQNLETQLDVFDEHRASDDEQLPGAKGIDLNSSLDVFHAIFRQVMFMDNIRRVPSL